MKYTDGQWEVADGNCVSVFSGQELICTLSEKEKPVQEVMANGMIIAASPDMYTALLECNHLAWFSEHDQPGPERMKQNLDRILQITRKIIAQMQEAA